MNSYIPQWENWIRKLFRNFKKLGLDFKRFLFKQFNKNIYTRILFINIVCFVISFIALTTFYDFSVKQITYKQIQQELMQKAKRVNYALLQQENWESLIHSKSNDGNFDKTQYEQIKFLSDIFDVKVTIFDKLGNIVVTSAQQEIVPGAEVDKNFTEIISSGETLTTKVTDPETNELTFIAAVPMGDSKDIIINGILLEFTPSKLDHNIASMRLYLMLTGIFLLIIIIFISVSQAMHISKPISQLSTYMADLNNGNYVKQENRIALDEIKTLTGQFNKLVQKMQNIQEQNQNIEEEKTKLFADISHELRTPLTTVQGFVEAIQDGVIKDKDLVDKYIEIIYTQTIHINRLIDDMLQLSRLESGTMRLEKIPLNLTTVAYNVVESMENVAQSMNINITFEKNKNQIMIMGDIDKIEQILKNLIQNAINASENGTIKIKVETFKDEVILSIKDNGVGIPNEDLPHIWERFYQSKAQRSNTKSKQGSGLGLSIVKHLVQLHEGKIEVESQLGIGTTFYIRFPAL